MRLENSVTTIPLVGPRYAKILTRLGVESVYDLLHYFPRSYYDSSKLFQISELSREEKRAFKARVVGFKSMRTRKKSFTIQSAILEDESAAVEATWFNQPYLKDTILEGNEYIFSGKLNPKSLKPQILSPEYELVKEQQTHVGIITPIYPLTQDLSNKWLRSRTRWLVDKLDYVEDLEDWLDQRIIKDYELVSLHFALRNIHFPQSQQDLGKAIYRLAFEEMLAIQIRILRKRAQVAKLQAYKMRIPERLIKDFISQVPFTLTQDQEIAIKEIIEDMRGDHPMNRLLSGDVGSGKTVVAVAASLAAIKAGYQSVIMVPTTILADQHIVTFTSLLEAFDIKPVLVSSNSKEKDFKNAELIIGTQAVLHQKEELFDNLGLIIVDEQHRFGVEQREELFKSFTKEGVSPHMLNMTATPIPRTLALTLFGDVSVSAIKTKPKDRKAVNTHLVPEAKREDSYSWIKDKALKDGVQTFWITPLIEESEKLESASALETFNNLKKALPELNIELLHGRVKPDEKQKILERFKDFKKHKIHILVSTSVIEVGIDIPNANIMVIEGAERFGLAQLHQLRGRVGRGDQEAWCFLYTSADPTEDQKSRLEYFTKESDGFNLAEFDLKRRGPGEVYGIRQSGIPELKLASIFDSELVEKTREAARKLI